MMLNDVAQRELSNLAINLHAKPGAFALLLGSGISREADIPTGWGVTINLVERLYRASNENGASITEEELTTWYRKKFNKEPDYSDLVERLGKTAAGERDLLAGFFEPLSERRDDPTHRRPTTAHRAVARLIARGVVKVVVTTNFDRLLEQALSEAGLTPDVVITDESDIPTAIPRVHANAVIIKVHGDYKRANLRNSATRLKADPDELRAYLSGVVRDYGLVIAGWSGGYDVALRDLLMSPGAYPTYWIEPYSPHRDAATLREARATTMIETSANEAFDRLQLKLEALRETPPPRSAHKASREVKQLLSEPQRYAIQLEDYLQELSVSLTEALKGDRYIPSFWHDPSEDTKFLESGLNLAAPAAAALATVARYDHDGHYGHLLRENFGLLERHPYDTSITSGVVKVLALRSVPFAVLCVLADQSRYARLTELASSAVRYPGFTRSPTPLVDRLVRTGSISMEYGNALPMGGFGAMKQAVALLPHGLLKDPTEALHLAEFLVVLTYLSGKVSAPKPFLTNYMYDSSSQGAIHGFLQSDIDHEGILPNFNEVLHAYDSFAERMSTDVPIWYLKGFVGGAVALFGQAQRSAHEGR